MSKRELVPKIIFKSCKNEWKINRFKDLFNHKSGTAIENFFNENGKYKVISIGSYSKNSKYIDQGIRVDLNPVTKSQIVNKNDLTMVLNDKTKDGQIIGRVLLVDKNDEYVINQRTERLIPKCIDSNFAFVYLNGPFRKVVKRMVQGGTQIYINYSAIEEQNVIVPKGLKEEIKLGNLFAKLDRLLDLQQQKLNQLELLKKALLQKLFPKQGAKIPELRFKGFEEKWKQDAILNIAVVTTGNTPSTNKKQYYSTTGIPWVTPSNINKEGKIVDEKHLSEQGVKVARIVPKGSVLVTSIASIGKNTLVKTSTAFNQQINAITPKENFDSYFIYISSIEMSKKMKTIASTGTMQIVNKKEFSEMEIQFPSISEQQKIGNLLAKVDHLIELENKKNNNLKLVKKSLLQNMFVE